MQNFFLTVTGKKSARVFPEFPASKYFLQNVVVIFLLDCICKDRTTGSMKCIKFRYALLRFNTGIYYIDRSFYYRGGFLTFPDNLLIGIIHCSYNV